MTDGADLLELLPPSVAGRIETLTGSPVRTIGDRLDDRTATVATLTVVYAQLTGVSLQQAADQHRTVLALRRAVDAAVLEAAQHTLTEARAAQDDTGGQQEAAAGDAGDGEG